jgi:hypothetical protein
MDARGHLEKALQLTNKEFIQKWLDSIADETQSKRGRKPGAAPAETRCQWSMADNTLCKNNRHDGNSFCRMHMAKVHLIDPGSA